MARDPAKLKAQRDKYRDKYREKNREKLRVEARRYREENGDKVRAAHRAYQKKHRMVDPARYLHQSAKDRAKLKGIQFHLVKEDIIIPERCPVLGIPLHRDGGVKNKDCAPSLDRINNTRGYTPDNIIVVSYRANRLKSDATVGELEAVASFYRGLKK